jgi:hypothetical protein
MSYTKLTADMTATTTTTLANITSLSFSVSNATYYRFQFGVIYQSNATTTGLKLTVTIPAATVFSAKAQAWSSAADGTDSEYVGRITSSGDAVTATGSEATNTSYLCLIEGVLVPSAGGTLQAQFASEVSGSTVTIKQGSYGILWTLP